MTKQTLDKIPAGRRDVLALSGASEGIGPQELSGPAVERLSAQLPDDPAISAAWLLEEMLARLTRERDEARAALASARAAALEEAATAATRAAWKHEGDDDYSRGMDMGAREQVEACAAAVRALKEAKG